MRIKSFICGGEAEIGSCQGFRGVLSLINAVPYSALIMALSPPSGFLYKSAVVFLTFKRLGILVIDNRQNTIL